VNWLDAVIVVTILWFTYAAFQTGFIREAVTVMAALLGVVLAGIFYTDFADDVLLFIDNDVTANIVAFALVFGAVALAGQLLALVLKPTVSMLQLGIFDQLAGALFGFIKAMIFIQVALIVFVTYPKWDMDETIQDSVFGSLIVEKTSVLVKVLPDEFEAAVDDYKAEVLRFIPGYHADDASVSSTAP
jgi:uncharacterized membrane protein required for colicin V production